MSGWTSPYGLLKEEFSQRKDEGVKIPENLKKRFLSLDPVRDAWNFNQINPIYNALMELPADKSLQKEEPNELEDIRKLRPDGPRNFNWTPSQDELIDKLHGAWTGRAVGCALGKPVEGLGLGRDENGKINGRKKIKIYLQNRGDWPLKDYFSIRNAEDGIKLGCPLSCRENISFMEADDDIHYSITGLAVLEEKGRNFKWDDIARFWLSHIPISAICTAEAQAILNVQNCSERGNYPAHTIEWISTYRNPYREWIGAQIRADGWAFCCAGNPELAAEFAWRDASWTHRRNGIYGEMMFAAIQAAAFCVSDPTELVKIGLSEIPRNCRLAIWVKKCLEWIKSSNNFEECMEKLETELQDMHVVHTINNALICIIAMFYGKLNIIDTPAIAVMCGLDTDCNGATTGSIVGAIHGRKNFNSALADRLNDTIKPAMVSFNELKMIDLARRCAKVRSNILNL
ncbi:MAG TPA: ADP-ribosylglycohydrolase family protein [Victivallales bacterium]|nr:ADP-ribosylglycohydrolase family protein [Victivallales bacterium]HRR28224.1 ADP-ribosylglycohydrolase family protein [Victivallales bacterium]HRU00708.1 ADP-ribosylglycohydrolase family protein [Victivallales bacterium]